MSYTKISRVQKYRMKIISKAWDKNVRNQKFWKSKLSTNVEFAFMSITNFTHFLLTWHVCICIWRSKFLLNFSPTGWLAEVFVLPSQIKKMWANCSCLWNACTFAKQNFFLTFLPQTFDIIVIQYFCTHDIFVYDIFVSRHFCSSTLLPQHFCPRHYFYDILTWSQINCALYITGLDSECNRPGSLTLHRAQYVDDDGERARPKIVYLSAMYIYDIYAKLNLLVSTAIITCNSAALRALKRIIGI